MGLDSDEANTRSKRTKEQVQTKNRNKNNAFPIRHAGRPADFLRKGVLPIVFNPFCMLLLMVPGS